MLVARITAAVPFVGTVGGPFLVGRIANLVRRGGPYTDVHRAAGSALADQVGHAHRGNGDASLPFVGVAGGPFLIDRIDEPGPPGVQAGHMGNRCSETWVTPVNLVTL